MKMNRISNSERCRRASRKARGQRQRNLRDKQHTMCEAKKPVAPLTNVSESRLNFDANCKYTKSVLVPQQIQTDQVWFLYDDR